MKKKVITFHKTQIALIHQKKQEFSRKTNFSKLFEIHTFDVFPLLLQHCFDMTKNRGFSLNLFKNVAHFCFENILCLTSWSSTYIDYQSLAYET